MVIYAYLECKGKDLQENCLFIVHISDCLCDTVLVKLYKELFDHTPGLITNFCHTVCFKCVKCDWMCLDVFL